MNKKLTAFEEARKNAKEGKEWFKTSWMGYSFVVELDDLENRVNVMELTEGQIYQYDEKIVQSIFERQLPINFVESLAIKSVKLRRRNNDTLLHGNRRREIKSIKKGE